MIESVHLELLRTAGAAENPHSGRSLFEHLESVSRLLREWGAPEHVCIAGLFHSIYGTESYPIKTVDSGRRDEVRAVIGKRAEELAHLFCTSERSSFFTTIEDLEPKLKAAAEDIQTPVSPETLQALIEMEVANVVEFIPHRQDTPMKLINYYTYLFGLDDRYMSAKARQAYTEAFEAVREGHVS